jgi:hypothetical protein
MDGSNNEGVDDDVKKKLELLLKLSYDAAMLGMMSSRCSDTHLNKQPRRIQCKLVMNGRWRNFLAENLVIRCLECIQMFS